MLKPVSNRNSVLACSADCPADNHARQLALFLYETLPFILNKITLILILLISGCSQKPTEIRHYPDEDIYKSGKTVQINLNQDDLTFKEITDSIHQYQTTDLVTLFELEDGRTLKRIMPYTYSGGLIKTKNVLTITTDSILIDNGYSIDRLPDLLARHYMNKGENPIYSDSPERAIVEVSLDTSKSAIEVKQFLNKLTQTFDNLKGRTADSLKLQLMFNYFRQIPPPPPPPKPEVRE